MRFFRLTPITRKRLRRFRQIRYGYYSFLILAGLTILSLFSNYIANSRAIVVKYEGQFYFPTYKFIPMSTFGQMDEWGFDDAEANYRLMKEQFAGTDNWVLMPPIPFNPIEQDYEFYDEPHPRPPDGRHILGTDGQGRDVLARLIYGFRISIFFALALTLVCQVIGIIIGSLQGFLGGRFDIYSQRLIEIWSTLPFLYVVVLLATFFRPNFWMLLFVLALFQWIGITYYMRTEMYREKAREYALAARSLGASNARIVFRHLLPNCLTPVITFVPFSIVAGILALTSLDFLGYGLPIPTPSWGEMIDQALQSSNRDKIWLSASPFAAIVFTLLLVTLIGESLREAFDPKQYAKFR